MSESDSKSESIVKKSEVQGNILHGFDKPNVRLLFFNFGINELDEDKVKNEKAKTVMQWLGELAKRDVLANTDTIVASSKKVHEQRLKDPNWMPQELWLNISLSFAGINKLRIGSKYLPVPPSTGAYTGVGLETRLVQPVQSPVSGDLHPRDALSPESTSPDPFVRGMKSRAGLLGDIGNSDPQNWDSFYRNDNDLHALFVVAADQENDLDIFVVKLISEALLKGITCVGIERGQALLNEQGKHVEHFGFRDGVSQPLIKGVDDAKIEKRRFYKDIFYPEDFVLFDLPGELKWANNGSFLVFRKLEQNVQSFWDFMRKAIEDKKVTNVPEELAAKIVGRWKSGAPLAEHHSYDPVDPSVSDENDFLYVHRKVLTTPNDTDGKFTPLFSHTRICNPRDMSPSGTFGNPDDLLKENAQHRILRRAIPYGPSWATNRTSEEFPRRGLLFMCYQRDILQQFEYIQMQLTNYTKSQYVESPHAQIESLFYEGHKHIMEEWVTTKGGGYFFSPSKTVLQELEKFLVEPKPSAPPADA